MQKLSTSFKVGLVVLIGLLATVIMILRFSANWGDDSHSYRLKAYFNDATGLAPRSQIKIAGIQVGEVESITLSNAKALITFKVRGDIKLYAGQPSENHTMSINGATVSKQLSGILGDYHLEITPGIDGRLLQDGDFIPNIIQGGGLEGVLSNAGDILQDVSQVTHNLADILGGENGNQQLSELIKNLNTTIENIKNLTDQNSEQISNIVASLETVSQNAASLSETGNQEIPQLVNDLSEFIQKANHTLDRLQSGVGDTFDDTRDSIATLKESIEKLDRTLSNVEIIAQNIKDGNGTIGKLLKDESIANEARTLLSETRTLINKGTETVDSANTLLSPLSNLDVDVALRGDYYINANAFRVDFGVKLQSSDDKYLYLGLVSDPHGNSKTQTILKDSTETGPVYETVTTRDNSVKFNLQYAKRWRWFTGRFGIIDSTGGLGGDVELFDDDLKFSVDLYAFNDNNYPRLRANALIYLSLFMPWAWTRSFYISGGVDDPINTDLIDYYVGIGFRFTDNDLKSFVSMIPTP